MKITVKKSTMVKPMGETPSGGLWLSNLDLLMPASYHTRTVYFFGYDGSADFFDAAALMAALSRALVHFYPLAGRLREDDDGRLEIHCNAQGVLFVEAESDGALEDLGDFSPRADVSLTARVDYSQGLSTYPLSLLQLTRFKCGGVSLGVANEHHVADGTAALHYINTWSDIARGLNTLAPPFIDRRLLAARNPLQHKFSHVEYQPHPPLKTPLTISDEPAFKKFKLTRGHLTAIKKKCNDGGDNKTGYTTYEAVAGHVWRCVTMARRLPHDQLTKLQMSVDSRRRLLPPLPQHFFGNGVFFTTPVALCGELESNPVSFAAGRIHEAVARMDDEYMRSAVDYLEAELPNIYAIARSEENVKCPNAEIVSWVRLPFYEADFGWGKPVFAGPVAPPFEGKCYLAADPNNEGNMMLTIALLKPHLELFEKLLFHSI